MDRRMEKGKRGERLAEEYLIQQGFVILEKNFRTRLGEIDLVCRDSDTIVFVEVKTRKNLDFGMPQEAVDYRKIKRINKVASIFISRFQQDDRSAIKYNYRFDVVSVILDVNEDIKSIELINNAF